MEIVYYDSICESCTDRFQFRVPGSLFEEFKIRLAEQKESILCVKKKLDAEKVRLLKIAAQLTNEYKLHPRSDLLEEINKTRAAAEKLLSFSKDANYYNRPLNYFLTEDDTYRTYCNEHAFIWTNLYLNLPQNERGYIEAYAADTGGGIAHDRAVQEAKNLFKLAQSRWSTISKHYVKGFNQEKMPEVPYFKPLFQRPVNENGKTKTIKNPLTTIEPGLGMFHAPLTTADIVYAFMSKYLNFTTFGPERPSYFLMLFEEIVTKRMGISRKEYRDLSIPIMVEVFKHAAMMVTHFDDNESDLERSIQGKLDLYITMLQKGEIFTHISKLLKGFNGQEKATEFSAKLRGWERNITQAFINPVIQELRKPDTIKAIAKVYKHCARENKGKDNSACSPEQTWKFFLGTVESFITMARNQNINTESSTPAIQFYVPPYAYHLIVNGDLKKHPDIDLRIVASVHDADEVTYSEKNQLSVSPETFMKNVEICSPANLTKERIDRFVGFLKSKFEIEQKRTSNQN